MYSVRMYVAMYIKIYISVASYMCTISILMSINATTKFVVISFFRAFQFVLHNDNDNLAIKSIDICSNF